MSMKGMTLMVSMRFIADGPPASAR
jgi:hypothetical protein